MKKFIVYYAYGKEVDKMVMVIEDGQEANLKEIFYDSVPEQGAKILEIKEV